MSQERQRWLIENRSGPLPVYFRMEMKNGEPVHTLDPEEAKAFPSKYAATIVMAEWELAEPWAPVHQDAARAE